MKNLAEVPNRSGDSYIKSDFFQEKGHGSVLKKEARLFPTRVKWEIGDIEGGGANTSGHYRGSGGLGMDHSGG